MGLNITPNAPLVSPGFTGVPTAPTATVGTDTDQIATTAFVQDALVEGGAANLTSNELTLGGRFKIVYNSVTDSLDFEVI